MAGFNPEKKEKTGKKLKNSEKFAGRGEKSELLTERTVVRYQISAFALAFVLTDN